MLTEHDLIRRSQERSDFAIAITPQTSGAYAVNQVLGGSFLIDNIPGTRGPIPESPMSGILQDLVLYDEDGQNAKIDLFFFNQVLATAMTDNALFNPVFADLKNCIGVVSIASADYIAAGSAAGAGGSVAAGSNQRNLGLVLKPTIGTATALYVVPVIRQAATYTRAVLQLRLKISQGL